MPGIELIQISDKEIIYIDYSGCEPAEMIPLFDEAKKVVLAKKGDCLLLTNFKYSSISPAYLRHVKKEMLLIHHLIKKNSFIGMTPSQQTILEGFRTFIRNDAYVHFDNRQEAINYLLS